MKNTISFKTALCMVGIIVFMTVIVFSIAAEDGEWINPATQTTKLTGGIPLLSYSSGNKNIPNSPYGYETWDSGEGSKKSTNKFTWYGANQGGGGAFKVEWTQYFLARLGFWWGKGGSYTQYKNIYIDYNFKRSDNSSSPGGGFIGVYGWFRSPSASKNIEKRIEYYIVEDWFYSGQMGIKPIASGGKNAKEIGSFTVDGATYKIYTNERINEPSIDGKRSFIQVFSVRQGRRTYGTISVTEHFKEWSKYLTLDNIYETKFIVEAFGGDSNTKGNLDLTYLYLAMEDTPRDSSKICIGGAK